MSHPLKTALLAVGQHLSRSVSSEVVDLLSEGLPSMETDRSPGWDVVILMASVYSRMPVLVVPTQKGEDLLYGVASPVVADPKSEMLKCLC